MIKTATTTPTRPDELSDQQACVFRSLPAMVYSYSVNHDTGKNNFPFVSDYCEEIFGLPASTIVNESESFVNLVHPDDVNAFAASVLHSMQTMTIWDHKMRVHNVNSEMVYIHGKSVPHREDILNADGSFTKLTVWHGVLFDITNRYDEECKNAREKTNDNNNDNNTGGSNGYSKIMRTKILRDDFSTKYAPSFDIDIDGNIEYWNDQMVTLVGGVLSSDVMGQNLRSLVSDSNQGQAETFLTTAASKCIDSSPHEEYGDHIYDEKYMTNLTLKSKIGGEVHLIITCYPRNDPPGLSCICEDITLIKVAEKEKKVALQLLDAEKTLSEWLSHEIRNPLTIAMEAAKSLKEIKSNRHNDPFGTESDAFKLGNSSTNIDFDEDSFSYVDLIIQSISYVVDLLSNILDLNKLAAGKIVLRPSKCSLKADIIQPIQEMMSVKNNNVPILFTGEDMNISIDSLRLKQVMTNLLSNAIKFTKKGFIKIHSERTQHGVDGRDIAESLVISVSDTGPGVPEKNRKLLFTKFEQLGSNVNGTGIGLCLARFLVMAMEGEILLNEHYDSGIPGSPGAQFVVRFPVKAIAVKEDSDGHPSLHGNDMKNSSISAYSALSAAVMATKKNSQDSNNHHYKYQSPEQNGTHISNKSYISGVYRLLIVDDDQIVRKLLKRRISRIFPQAIVDEVDCGEKAIECAYGCSSSTSSSLPLPLSKAIYDIIFIDHFMGDGLTGDQTIKELRDNNVDSLIIGISGNSMESTHISAGAEDFFQKPLPAQSILIQRLIQKLPPPAGWNVLIVDDIKMNCHFLERRLHRISSAHFTTMSQAQQRWQITKITNANDAIEKIKTDHYDLIVLDQELNDDQGVKGSDIAAFARKHGHCRNGIIALNSASTPDIKYPQFFNMSWTKPLPGEGRMRQTLCEELIRLQY